MRPTVSCPSAAHELLHDDRLLVLATETIGVQLSAVALLDRHGTVLLATSICPTCPIPALSDAPSLEVVWPMLAALLTNRIVVGFQVARDRRVLRHAARRLGATLMYTDWRSVGAVACPSPARPPTYYPTRAARTEPARHSPRSARWRSHQRIFRHPAGCFGGISDDPR